MEETSPRTPRTLFKLLIFAFMIVLVAVLSCARTVSPALGPWSVSTERAESNSAEESSGNSSEQSAAYQPAPADPNAAAYTPTPDAPHALPTLRVEPEEYIVQSGDSLGRIAERYHVSLEQLIEENNLTNPDLLEVGQLLVIPVSTPTGTGPAFKVLPDSELVYSPALASFEAKEFIRQKGGYLSRYEEEVDGVTMSGAGILERVAAEYSVNPRLLLAVLEYQSGWVTKDNPPEETRDFPINLPDNWRKGLYRQLSYAANNLNRGYYLWRVNGIGAWLMQDGTVLPINPSINAGTAGVQYFFSLFYTGKDWQRAVGPEGLFAVYNSFFGYPFSYSLEPLVPEDFRQPKMQLPFEEGDTWSFTGGPHGGWGDGSAWAALDFAPPGEALGCVQSDAWVTAVAAGPIIRAGFGEVVQDIDTPEEPADGLENTGWTVVYMHIESRDRVQPGTYLQAGERVGHASCEGGYSTGTHVHLARRYNGEWIPADQQMPFILDRWVSRGLGGEYDGYLERDGVKVEAWEGRHPENAISR